MSDNKQCLNQKDMAMAIAVHIRNCMEDFHVEHLTDEQMAELNPIIRNAVFEFLVVAQLTTEGHEPAQQFIGFLQQAVPDYWENPVVSDDLREFLNEGSSVDV